MIPHPTLLKTLQKEPPEINLPRKWNPGRRIVKGIKDFRQHLKKITEDEQSVINWKP